jgi:SAM-dependent methyltransferase
VVILSVPNRGLLHLGHGRADLVGQRLQLLEVEAVHLGRRAREHALHRVGLDVVEHLADPRRALAEAHRVLRPGGVVILSVPNRGLLHRFDALNVYSGLRRKRPHWPPLESDTESAGGVHRHFTPDVVERLLAPAFRVDRVARTGLGLQEFLYLGLLLARVPLRRDRVLRGFLPVHLLLYVLDDAVPWGRLGYHLAVRGVREEPAP